MAPIHPDFGQDVRTTSGIVRGFIDTYPLSVRSTANLPRTGGRHPVSKWLGIPYAEAKRWERPIAARQWAGVRNCWEFGPSFPQADGPLERLYDGTIPGWLVRKHLGQSEDAFTLNIFRPATDDQNLPVMVWFHGGALNTGSSNHPLYDPSELLREQNVCGRAYMVVTVNYRIGIFGWLAMQELAEVNGEPGNYGLYDAISALEWVQKNISRFGGNAQNVTAVGESAGAFIVAALMGSGRRLFQKAILESGNSLSVPLRAEPAFPPEQEFLKILGISKDHMTVKDLIDRLRQTDSRTLLRASQKVFYHSVWAVTRDPKEKGWRMPFLALAQKGHTDPWVECLIISVNQDEGTFFNAGKKFWYEENLVKHLKAWGMFTPSMLSTFRETYDTRVSDPLPDGIKTHWSSQFCTDQRYLAPTKMLADALIEASTKYSVRPMKVYLCHFSTMASRLLQAHKHLGITHTGEIPFVFNTASLWDYDNKSADGQTASTIGASWALFCQTGDPGWTQYSTVGGEMMEVCNGGFKRIIRIHDIRPRQRAMWESFWRSTCLNAEDRIASCEI